MDTRYGKYDGPLAVLLESWSQDGHNITAGWSNADLGEGIELWSGPFALTWRDARFLMAEHAVEWNELDALADELTAAKALVFTWDNRGFFYAESLTDEALVHAAIGIIERRAAEEGVDA